MLSLLRRLIIFAIFVCVMAFIFRTQAIIYALKFATQRTTTFSLRVESLDFSRFIPPVIFAYNITLENPEDFEEANALLISRVEAIAPNDFWENLDRPRITRLKLDITQLTVVRNSLGKLNVLVIDEIAKNNPGRLHPYPLIEDLELSIEKVAFYDCYGTANVKVPPQVTTINLKGQRYHNVQNVSQLERLIIREAMKRTKFRTLEDTYTALEIQPQP